ncbi:MAG: hypothetical protein Q8N91_05060 [Candidatus Omnitrophota bacterium]|nr:hypothetical protein [Candidatus Omnitrophota bacterium]
MKKTLITVLALVCAASLCYAAEEASPKATEPVSATVEAAGTFVGKVVNVVTLGAADTTEGASKASVTVLDETGKTMMFPIDSTVKIVDAAMNTIPLKQLKDGTEVVVKYVTGKNGAEKTESVTVVE